MAGMSRRDWWICGLYAWWGRFGDGAFHLSEIHRRPVRLLICLPSNPEEARKAAAIIPELIACLRAEVVFVVGEPRSVEFYDPEDDRITVVPLDRSARWWFGLPSFGIVARLAEAGLNLAVDLNPRAELLPAVLCRRIGAKIRLSLDDPQRGQMFNVRILLAEKQGSPYARMLRVVQAVAHPAVSSPD